MFFEKAKFQEFLRTSQVFLRAVKQVHVNATYDIKISRSFKLMKHEIKICQAYIHFIDLLY